MSKELKNRQPQIWLDWELEIRELDTSYALRLEIGIVW